MCGIAGWISWKASPNEEVVRTMTDRMRHRGPDHGGVLRMNEAAFGHRRLSILDLRSAANQPMVINHLGLMITFNGEIYNFRQLRDELRLAGYSFYTECDTEVLVNCYAEWGEACLEKLDGMFAFAIWDDRRKCLLMARDRLGEKPLYYYRLRDGGVAFASELTSLILHPEIDFQINTDALTGFLAFNYIAGDICLVEGIRKLPPATCMTLGKKKDAGFREYWSPLSNFEHKTRYNNIDEAGEELRLLIAQSVQARMISDVPLGSFLSGGIDSSCIVGTMSENGNAQSQKTFSIGFQEPSYSEIDKAKLAAKHFGVGHHSRIISDFVADDFKKIMTGMDQPVADTSIIPTYYLANLARKSVTVALSGDGADELFAGYSTYQADKLRYLTTWIPSVLTKITSKFVRALLADSGDKVPFEYMLKQFLDGHSLESERAHCSWREIFSNRQIEQLFNRDFKFLTLKSDPYAPFEKHFKDAHHLHYLDQALYVDLKTWLVDDILVKLDRATMSNSLEARPPFLDHRLVEWAASLPVHWKLRRFQRKYILRHGFQGKLPPSSLNAPKKGFNAPVSHWLKYQLKDISGSAIFSDIMKVYFDSSVIERLWLDHQNGKRDHGFRLFSLACLGIWLEEYSVSTNR